MNINLEYYKIFYYVAKLQGITKAAEELSLSQPAVSQAIRHLEENLGASLFQRTSKGVVLTTEGRLLFTYIEKGYETIRLGEENFFRLLNLESGEVRIGASDMTLRFFLLPYLEHFHEQFPKIKVKVTNGPTPETLLYLQEGKIDFGIVSSPVIAKSDLQIKPVKVIQDAFVAGPKFTYFKKEELSFDNLKSLPIICLEKNTSSRKYLDSFLKERGHCINPEFELATSDMIVEFAARNLGIGYVMEEFASAYLESGKLFKLKLKDEIPQRNFYLVWNENRVLSKAARELFTMIDTGIKVD